MPNNIQTIMRTAAMIYADDQAIRSSKTVKRNYCESVLVNNGNSPLTLEQIIKGLLENFDLVVNEDEILDIISDDKYFVCIQATNAHLSTYYLPQIRFESKSKKSEYCLSDVIDEYIADNKLSSCRDELVKLLHRYLYSLLNTNIKAYSQLLEKKKIKQSPVIDSAEFSNEEINSINDFLEWESDKKDKALFELICYCIEYASAINNINQNDVVKSFKNKQLYLDNALIYRALGINGQYRKERVRNLLKRCVDSGQTIVISSITRKEFFDSIDFHIEALSSSTPYGKVNPSIFEKYSGGYGFYHYYHDWRRNRISYGFSSLRVFIKSEYEQLLSDFSIVEKFNQPFNDEEDCKIIDEYTEGIKSQKNTNKDNLHANDARNILWIESLRAGNDSNVRDTKYYFLTPDRKLQDWDFSHSSNQPITLLPSQWLALLLRFFSNSNNDFKSFVSFLMMPKDLQLVTEDELQEKIAGISEITEDFQKQDDIISSLLELERNSKTSYSREDAKNYAKEKIEEDYQKQLCNEKAVFDGLLMEQKKNAEELISKIKEEFDKKEKQARYDRLLDKQTEIERQINSLSDKERMIKEMAQDRYGIFRRSIAFFIIIIVLAWFFLIYRFGWSTMEVYTYVVGTLLCIGPFIASLITDKTIKVSQLLKRYLSWQINNLSKQFVYSKSEQDDLEHSHEIVQKQIDCYWEE